MKKLYKLWRLFLPFLFIFISIHFIKDITQDILQIKTPLDIFGDVQEDLKRFDDTTQKLYLYGLGGASVLTEVFLLISIPIVWRRKMYSSLEKYISILSIFLFFYFLLAILLDPRF